MVKVHINNTKYITIVNIYIPLRDSTSPHYKTADTDIQHCIQYITTIRMKLHDNNIIPIPKPNKDMSIIQTHLTSLSDSKIIGDDTTPIHHKHIPQHGFKIIHTTSTALHNINNNITTGFNQNKPPEHI